MGVIKDFVRHAGWRARGVAARIKAWYEHMNAPLDQNMMIIEVEVVIEEDEETVSSGVTVTCSSGQQHGERGDVLTSNLCSAAERGGEKSGHGRDDDGRYKSVERQSALCLRGCPRYDT